MGTLDSEMGGFQEFVGMDIIGVEDQKFVFVVEQINPLSDRPRSNVC